jgi:hypothetical protein
MSWVHEIGLTHSVTFLIMGATPREGETDWAHPSISSFCVQLLSSQAATPLIHP